MPSICVAAGKNVEQPLVKSWDGDGTFNVTTDKSSVAAVCIVLKSGKDAVGELTLTLADDATLTCLLLQSPDSQPSKLTHTATLGRGARLQMINVTLASIEHTFTCRVGEGALSAVDWLLHATGSDRMTLAAENAFTARDGRGEMTIRGIAEGKATVKATGKIDIAEAGGGTQTHLAQHVLMLDPTARVEAVPALSIRTNDVKAGHAATVSRVSDEDLFYLTSRGIPKTEARALIVEGFLDGMLVKITDPMLRELVRDALRRKASALAPARGARRTR